MAIINDKSLKSYKDIILVVKIYKPKQILISNILDISRLESEEAR